MGTEVLKIVDNLESELEKARNSLKDYDENIKRLIGRDPSETARPNNKRSQSGNQTEEYRGRYNDNSNNSNNRYNENTSNRQRNQYRNQAHENGESASKRRGVDSVFKRLDKPRYEEEDYPNKLQIHSRVIVTPREVPSRQEALAAQDRDEKSKARNRRMFGALLGTLQKFRQEETKLKTKEEKRAQVEKKLEEQEILEKARLKKERYELFVGRKRKQQEIRVIEQKMQRMKELTDWENSVKPLANFIQTKSKPHIYYLPRKMNDKTKEKVAENRKIIEKRIEDKQKEVQEELENFERRLNNGLLLKSEIKEDPEMDEAYDIAHNMLEFEDEEMPLSEQIVPAVAEGIDGVDNTNTNDSETTENDKNVEAPQEDSKVQVKLEETEEKEASANEQLPENAEAEEVQPAEEQMDTVAENTDLNPSEIVADSETKTDNESAPS